MTLSRWLPVDYVCGDDGVRIRWMDFGATLPSEPFFYQTLQRLRRSRPPAREGWTGMASLLERARQLEPATPAGVIFHISRCGSTVFSSALSQAEKVVVLPEARPVAMFSDPVIPESSREALLHSIVRLYAHPRGADAHRVVIKCHTVQMLHLHRMRQVWPDVPFLVVIRDPVEVLVSNLKLPAGWLKTRENANTRKLLGRPDAEDMTTEEYAARCIGRFCQAALGVAGNECRVVDYEDLSAAAIRDTAAHFGLELAPGLNLEERLARYAKDPEGARNFQDDRAGKQREATAAIRQAVAKWALKPYQALRASRGISYGNPGVEANSPRAYHESTA